MWSTCQSQCISSVLIQNIYRCHFSDILLFIYAKMLTGDVALSMYDLMSHFLLIAAVWVFTFLQLMLLI